LNNLVEALNLKWTYSRGNAVLSSHDGKRRIAEAAGLGMEAASEAILTIVAHLLTHPDEKGE